MASVCRLTVSSTAPFHSAECGSIPFSRSERYNLTEDSYKPSSTTETYEVVWSRKSLSFSLAISSSACLRWWKELRKWISMRSALCPSMENRALCPLTWCSSFSSAAPASDTISFWAFSLNLRHSVQRKRNIWCRTLEPSKVNGTACNSCAASSLSALIVDAISCLFFRSAIVNCKPAALNFLLPCPQPVESGNLRPRKRRPLPNGPPQKPNRRKKQPAAAPEGRTELLTRLRPSASRKSCAGSMSAIPALPAP